MKIHFIAIGGSIMHQLAIQLKKQGHDVSGSDDTIFDPALTNLKKEDIFPVEFGWFPEKIEKNIDLVVLGKHAHADNPELAKAKDLDLRIVSFPELVYEHAKDKTRIVVAGSHGKTSTSSMIVHTLWSLGIECDYLVGAAIEGIEGSVRLSKEAKYIVIEGDEYPTSSEDMRPKIFHYQPHITIITGIAWDHANVFKTEEGYNKLFAEYIRSLEQNSTVIYCKEDPVLNDMVQSFDLDLNFVPYKAHPFENIDGESFLSLSDRKLKTQIFGKHNMQNLCAAKKVCKLLDIPTEDFYKVIVKFRGAAKRLEEIYCDNNLVVYKDYAHSPSKVAATVKAVREKYANWKLLAFAELHTYSSLSKEFLPQYKGSLDAADIAIVHYDPEAMRIKRMPDLDPNDVRKAFQKEDLLVTTNEQDLKKLIGLLYPEKMVLLFMSSGNYGNLDLYKLADGLKASVNINI